MFQNAKMNLSDSPKDDSGNFWYPLDNAAKIFPAITTDEHTSVFRVSVVLKQKVHVKSLFKAVRSIELRFPYYKVKMKLGFFWYYFESANFPTPVEIDNEAPCRRFQKSGHLFRVLVIDNRISVEFSHILTDGAGAFEYLKTLLITYFKYRGIEPPRDFDYLRPDEKPDKKEFEDSYNRYFKENIPSQLKRPEAFHLPFPLNKKTDYDVLTVLVSMAEIKERSKEKGVSITVYLVAVYLNAIQEIFEKQELTRRQKKYKKLSVEVPVNLRKIYPSKTMRNFSLFVMPEIDLSLGHYSFDEILKTVYHQMQLETDEKLINKILARNVGSERKFLIRSIPLFIKSVVLRMNYYSLGSSQYSGTLTNLGKKDFPLQIRNQIDRLALVPPPPNKNIKVSCGIIGFNDKLILSFGNITKTKELEKRFIQFLVKQDIHVKLVT